MAATPHRVFGEEMKQSSQPYGLTACYTQAPGARPREVRARSDDPLRDRIGRSAVADSPRKRQRRDICLGRTEDRSQDRAYGPPASHSWRNAAQDPPRLPRHRDCSQNSSPYRTNRSAGFPARFSAACAGATRACVKSNRATTPSIILGTRSPDDKIASSFCPFPYTVTHQSPPGAWRAAASNCS